MYFGFKQLIVQLFCNTNLRKKIDEIFVYFYGCQYKAQIMYQGQPLALLHCTVITVTYYYWSSTYVHIIFVSILAWVSLSTAITIQKIYHPCYHIIKSLTISSLYMENVQPTSAKKISPHMLLQIFDQIFVNFI